MSLKQILSVILVAVALGGCGGQPRETIIITATPSPPGDAGDTSAVIAAAPQETSTPRPPSPVGDTGVIRLQYQVRAGDTLSGIAAIYGISVAALAEANQIGNADQIAIGQELVIPVIAPDASFRDIVPNDRFVYGTTAAAFDTITYVETMPGFLKQLNDQVDRREQSGASLVAKVAQDFSIDPRLLLTFIELDASALSDPAIDDARRDDPLGYKLMPPVIGSGRTGLFRQLNWLADQLNRGYYGWRLQGVGRMRFSEEERYIFSASNVSAASAAIFYVLSIDSPRPALADRIAQFETIYNARFGDPFADRGRDPIAAPIAEEPRWALPFTGDETWYFTGGMHGGWGSGSAWAAIDFAPPDDLSTKTSSCYVSDYFVTAPAAGIIVRSADGAVVLDTDGDGDETTGWALLILHLAEQDRVAVGQRVAIGDAIGRPSCDGGFSNGTHVHIARKYNGEWMPASCETCATGVERSPLIMGGWRVRGLPGQEYQGFLERAGERKIAEQRRNVTDNTIRRDS